MRRYRVAITVVAALGLTACGAASTSETKPERTPITAPATKARGAVDAQNAQLKQMEQQTASADPTVAP